MQVFKSNNKKAKIIDIIEEFKGKFNVQVFRVIIRKQKL